MVPGGSRRGGGHDAVGRFSTALPWRLGVEPRRARMGWRRVERPRSITEEPRTGRGEHGAWPATLTRTAASAQQKQGREGESRESRGKRERNLIDFKFEAFSKFSINTRKILNMKDVPNFKSYHFCFRPTFIWDPIQKFNLNPDKCSYYPVRAKFKFFFDFCLKT